MDNTIITRYRRANFAKATCGEIGALLPITHVAFGSGGVDSEGNVLTPAEDQTALRQPIGSYPIDGYEIMEDGTTVRYTVTLPKGTPAEGALISEAALVDSGGGLCAIKNMLQKGKDGDVTLVFRFDDTF